MYTCSLKNKTFDKEGKKTVDGRIEILSQIYIREGSSDQVEKGVRVGVRPKPRRKSPTIRESDRDSTYKVQ